MGAAGEGEEGGRGEGLKSDMRARENDLFHQARADVVHLSQCGVSVSHATKPFRPFSLHTCMVCAFDWLFPFHGGYFVVLTSTQSNEWLPTPAVAAVARGRVAA